MSFQRKPTTPLTAEAAKLKAMRLLARREHSTKQLATKLKAGGVEEADVTPLLMSLTEDGWQSNERFARAIALNRVAQGLGPLRIRAELAVAGVADVLIRQIMDELEVDWVELCAQTHARKFTQLPKTAAERNKQWRTLAQRGFDGAQIQTVLKGDFYADEADGF